MTEYTFIILGILLAVVIFSVAGIITSIWQDFAEEQEEKRSGWKTSTHFKFPEMIIKRGSEDE